MKKILTLFLLLSIQVPLSAQRVIRKDPHETIDATWNPYLDGRPIKEPEWNHILFSEGKGILYDKAKTSFYYGSIKYRNYDNCYIRDGEGVSKILTEYGREYWWGEWKRDYLDGSAMMLKEDGTYVYGEWSFGRLKKDTERPLTNEEREDFDKRIHKLETSISLICP